VPAPNPYLYVNNPTATIDPLGLAPCKVHASVAGADWGTKGAHVHVAPGKEVRIFPDSSGGVGAKPIRLSTGTPTPHQVQHALPEIYSNRELRRDIVEKATEVMKEMNAGSYGMTKNRAAEMYFLVQALARIS
jgi:uncharacterized protein RhaS with RHS repeats